MLGGGLPYRKPLRWNISPTLTAASGLWREMNAAGPGLVVPIWGGGAQQVDLVTGAMSATSGVAPGPVAPEIWGAGLDFTAGDGLQWGGGRYAGTGRDVTLAVVAIWDTNDRRSTLATAGTNSGVRLQRGMTGFTDELVFTKGGVADIRTAIPLTTGAPTFAAISYRHSDGAINAIARRLDTGEISTGSTTNSNAWVAGDGNFVVANGPFTTSFDFDGRLGLAYIGWEFLDAARLLRWALDPFTLIRPSLATTFPALFAPVGGATTFTTTSSLDSLIQKQNILTTASLDSYLQKQGITATSDVDALLQKTILNTTPNIAHYVFQNRDSLTGAILRGNSLTYTRGAASYYFDSSGNLTSASSNTPRFGYDPSTGDSLGLLFDSSQYPNLGSNPNTFSSWTLNNVTVNQDQTSISGDANTAWTLTDSNNGDDYIRETETVADNTDTHGHSVYMKAGTSSVGRLSLIYTTGGTLTIYQAVFNLSTGAVSFTSAGAESGIRDLGSGIYEVFISAPNTGDGNTSMLCDIRVGSDDSGTGTIIIERSYIFDGDRPPMWNDTASGDSILTTSISSLPSEYTLYVRGYAPWKAQEFSRFITLSDGTTSNFIALQIDGNRSFITHVVDGGVDQVLTGPGVNPSDNQEFTMALRVKANDFRLELSTGDGVSDASGTVPTGLDTLDIGHNSLGVNGFYTGYIQEAAIIDDALTDDELSALAQTKAYLYPNFVDVDAVIKKNDVLTTASIDSLLKKTGLTTSVNVDALLQVALTDTTELDALVKALDILETTSIDALLKKTGLSTSSSLDAIIIAAVASTTTASLDGLLKKLGIEVSVNADALIKKLGLTDTSDLDALLKKEGIISTSDLDALIKKGNVTTTSSLDALLKKSASTTASLDAIIISELTKITSTSLDALLKKNNLTVTSTIDALLKKEDITLEANLDALIQKNIELTVALNALIQKSSSSNISVDALMSKSVSLITNLDAYLTKTGVSISSNLDAIISFLGTSSSSLDALIKARAVVTSSLDTLITSIGNTISTSLDAIISPSSVKHKARITLSGTRSAISAFTGKANRDSDITGKF